MSPFRQGYVTDHREVGAASRVLRQKLGYTLEQAAPLAELDAPSLSRAERGIKGYSGMAQRALAAFAAERERRAGSEKTDPASHEVRTTMYLPDSVVDIADELREPDRRARFVMIQDAFGASCVVVERGENPELAEIQGIGTINLDSLHVRTTLIATASGRSHVIPFRDPIELDQLGEALPRFVRRVVRFAERHGPNR